ncbi:MAG: hypothetical protein SH850_17950 [Planctomycetaceae bacterium]|nr:hypothetical protein [Planctomycetaceae bacterium]
MSSSPPEPRPQRPKPSRRRAVAKAVEPVVVPSADAHLLTWREWWRRVRVTLGIGLAISLSAHIAIGLLLAVWMISPPLRGSTSPQTVSWLDSTTIIEPIKKPRQPVSIPLTIPAEPAGTPVSKPVATTTPSAATAGNPAVKIAAVGAALGNRGMGLGGGKGTGAGTGELEALGGSSAAQRAVKAGLGWLARQQNSDGRWELHQGYPDPGLSVIRTDTGATSLALLAFLGAGHTQFQGDHAPQVKNGLQWLVDVQDKTTGDLHDQRQEEGRQPAFYAHAMGTIALCEALALTQDDSLREPASIICSRRSIP